MVAPISNTRTYTAIPYHEEKILVKALTSLSVNVDPSVALSRALDNFHVDPSFALSYALNRISIDETTSSMDSNSSSIFLLPTPSTDTSIPFTKEDESLSMDIDTELPETASDIDSMEVDNISTSSLTGITTPANNNNPVLPLPPNFEGVFVKMLKGLSIDSDNELACALRPISIEQEDSYMIESGFF